MEIHEYNGKSLHKNSLLKRNQTLRYLLVFCHSTPNCTDFTIIHEVIAPDLLILTCAYTLRELICLRCTTYARELNHWFLVTYAEIKAWQSLVTVLHICALIILKGISMQNFIKIYHAVKEL